MTKLKFLGTIYRGDGLLARAGDIITVTDAKAEQLLRDFPGEWRAIEESDPQGKSLKKLKNKMKEAGEDKGVRSGDDETTAAPGIAVSPFRRE